MKYLYGTFTDKGLTRKNNEDSILAREARIADNSMCIGVVCDGVGGLRKGEVASSTAVKEVSKWFEETALKSSSELTFDSIRMSLLNKLYEINNKIIRYSEEKFIFSGTTISLVLLFNERYIVANLGDSRVYHMRDRLSQITKDDSACMEDKNGIERNVLTQCLGLEPNVAFFTDEGILHNGEALMFCSDGFYQKMVSQEVEDFLGKVSKKNNVEAMLRILVEAAKQREETDNISVGFIKMVELKLKKVKWSLFKSKRIISSIILSICLIISAIIFVACFYSKLA